MHEYLFDGRLIFGIRVRAEDQQSAIDKILAALNRTNVTVEIDGEPNTFEASIGFLDEGPDLLLSEIDGEAP